MSRQPQDLDALARGIEARDPRALGRAISLLERADGDAAAEELVRRLHPEAGRARLLGVTGPPGSGKSTLVEGLVGRLREHGETVAVLAVDPTSPFTGGALLGDRIRMQSVATDPGVFIRSMATRGALGGLAAAAHDAVDLLDAAGFDTVVVETVGVGQDEVDVVRSVDTVAVVVIPGMGDDVQAAKAGLLEIADVFVLNKADRDGADRTYEELMFVLRTGETEDGTDTETWTPPVVRTVARAGEGIGELVEALESHRRWLGEEGRLSARRRRRLGLRVEEVLKRRVLAAAQRGDRLERELDRALAEGLDPYRAADRLFRELAPAEPGAPLRDGGRGGTAGDGEEEVS